MIELQFSAEDLGRIRFAVSPLKETVLSIRTLASGVQGLNSPWLQRVRPQLGVVDMDLLTSLVRPTGYIPDFLTPAPVRTASSLASGLVQVAATELGTVVGELTHLSEHAIAQYGPGRERRVALIGELIEDPAEGLARIVAEVDNYWRIAIAPRWPRMRTLLQADVNHRLEELASGGVDQMFRTLHPLVSFSGDSLRIAKYYSGQAHLRQRGLLLIPCVFASPDVIVGTADPTAASVSYPPRGLGRLWSAAVSARTTALSDVVGSSRAAILAALDLPMSTTALAAALRLSAPTTNVHLSALKAAGIVSARRDGRTVLYARTILGDHLLDPPIQS